MLLAATGLAYGKEYMIKRKKRPHKEDNIRKEAEWSHPEWAVLDVVATFDEETGNGYSVGDVEEDYASCNHAESKLVRVT